MGGGAQLYGGGAQLYVGGGGVNILPNVINLWSLLFQLNLLLSFFLVYYCVSVYTFLSI